MNNTPEEIYFKTIIPLELAGNRLDQALSKLFPEHSRARLQTWIRDQQVLIDGKPLRPRDKVKGGELVIVQASIETKESWQPQAINLDIVFEDESVIVINKPVGLVVHPAAGNRDGTLLNALLHHCPQLNKIPRAGIIHRLDKDTSGLLVITKTLTAHTYLVNELQNRHIHREYTALVNGVMTAGGTVDAPIGRHPIHRKRMAIKEEGKSAVTHYRVLEKFKNHTLVKVMLETGRTHQIRVHMAYIHYPIVGDKTYGGRPHIPRGASPELLKALAAYNHQALHATRLQLMHPKTHELVEWSIPLPEDMQTLINLLHTPADS